MIILLSPNFITSLPLGKFKVYLNFIYYTPANKCVSLPLLLLFRYHTHSNVLVNKLPEIHNLIEKIACRVSVAIVTELCFSLIF